MVGIERRIDAWQRFTGQSQPMQERVNILDMALRSKVSLGVTAVTNNLLGKIK